MISLVSDLHLDLLYPRAAEALIRSIARHGTGQPLILAGDIASVHTKRGQEVWRELIDHTKTNYSEILAVLGNHEHYEGTFDTTASKIPQGVTLLNRNMWLGSGYQVYGCTLWSEIPTSLTEKVERSFNDYHQIYGFTVAQHNAEYKKDQTWLSDQLFFNRFATDVPVPTIVVTHHAPLLNNGCSAPEYLNKSTNYFFESDQSNLITDCTPEIWCFGHTHHRADFRFSETRIVTNCCGYSGELGKHYEVKDLLLPLTN